ncbi:MAG: hypothetical protein ACQESR_25835 [Planctomycetota bacterium]
MSLDSYRRLLDWTARLIQSGERSTTAEDLAAILDHMNILEEPLVGHGAGVRPAVLSRRGLVLLDGRGREADGGLPVEGRRRESPRVQIAEILRASVPRFSPTFGVTGQ